MEALKLLVTQMKLILKKTLKFICLKLQLTESEILQQMSIYIRLTVNF